MVAILFSLQQVLRNAIPWTDSHPTIFVDHLDVWWLVHWLQKSQLMFSIIVDHNDSNNFSVKTTWLDKQFDMFEY